MSDLNHFESSSHHNHHSQQTSSALLEQLVYIDTFMNSNGAGNGGGSTGDLTPNLDIDGQLSMDLAAFADDSFIFPDEDKPKHGRGGHDDDDDEMDLDAFGNGDNNHNNHDNGHIKSEGEDPLLSSNLASSTDSSPNFQHLNGNNHHQQQLLQQHQSQQLHHNPSQLVLSNTFNNNNTTTSNSGNSNSNGHSVLDDINISKLPKFPVPPGAKNSLVSAGLSQNQIDLLSALIAQHQTRLGNPIPGSSSSNSNSNNNGDYTPQLISQNFNSPVRQHNQLQSFSSTSTNEDAIVNGSNGTTGALFNDSPVSMTSSTTTLQASPSLTIKSDDTFSLKDQLSGGSSGGSHSAELDKRRRNTAASARFRIKKKLKEKQMEHRIFSLNETIKEFEIKIQQLEMENKLLRNLIIEKGSQKSDNELKLLRERAKLN
ncbi:uncharacterized protein RJT21DRAFT_46589 [Scheffersomyces amazonensis]|uniref:uncharacterized protein n=1 Tax=Scheffersomyces amazonensis TaxID=1078765 RepID=UPI00315DA63B